MAKTNKAPEKTVSRVGYTLTEEGRKVRMLKKTGEIID